MNYPSDWDVELSKKPICGVIAIATVASITFAAATECVKRNLLPTQKRHGGRMYNEQITACLKDLGIDFEKYEVAKIQLRKWVREYAALGVTYIVRTGQHFLTIRDGVVIDKYQIAGYLEHKSGGCFVKEVWHIYE